MWAGSPCSVDAFWQIHLEHLPARGALAPHGPILVLIRLWFRSFLDYLENLSRVYFVISVYLTWVIFREGVFYDALLGIYFFVIVLERT